VQALVAPAVYGAARRGGARRSAPLIVGTLAEAIEAVF
jgi:hypothetical protein